ncbi:MAG: hypothetical protein C0514_03055 [Candidatus Puniceispirillum sp.]|nr:hypothetical protein [Candidatus Puniceispirillum sp.]
MMGQKMRVFLWFFLLAFSVNVGATCYSEWRPGYGLARRHKAPPGRAPAQTRPVRYVEAAYLAPLKELLGRTGCAREQDFLIDKTTFHTPETFENLAHEQFDHLEMVAILSQDPKAIASRIPLIGALRLAQHAMGSDGTREYFQSHMALLAPCSAQHLCTMLDMCHKIESALEAPAQRVALARHITSLTPEKLTPLCALLSGVVRPGLCRAMVFAGISLTPERLHTIADAGFEPMQRPSVVMHLAELDACLYPVVKDVLQGFDSHEACWPVAKECRRLSQEELRWVSALPKEERLNALGKAPPLTEDSAVCSRSYCSHEAQWR